MSLGRIHRVTKAGKTKRERERKCGKCGVVINIGDPYIWWQHRYGGKHLRCTKASCFPRQSERESSLMAEVYSAQEAFDDDIAAATTRDEAWDAFTSLSEAIREFADERRSALEEGWPNGNSTLEERCDEYEQWAEELEQANEPDETLEDDDGNVIEEGDAYDEWLQQIKDDLAEAAGSIG
jgi:hypothetical protein